MKYAIERNGRFLGEDSDGKYGFCEHLKDATVFTAYGKVKKVASLLTFDFDGCEYRAKIIKVEAQPKDVNMKNLQKILGLFHEWAISEQGLHILATTLLYEIAKQAFLAGHEAGSKTKTQQLKEPNALHGGARSVPLDTLIIFYLIRRLYANML